MKNFVPTVVHKILQKDDSKIILREFSGVVSLDDLIKSFQFIKENLLDETVIGLVSEFSKADIGMKLSELDQVMDFLNNNLELMVLPHAVIVDTPEKTIFPFAAMTKSQSLCIHPFSTIEAGFAWICSC